MPPQVPGIRQTKDKKMNKEEGANCRKMRSFEILKLRGTNFADSFFLRIISFQIMSLIATVYFKTTKSSTCHMIRQCVYYHLYFESYNPRLIPLSTCLHNESRSYLIPFFFLMQTFYLFQTLCSSINYAYNERDFKEKKWNFILVSRMMN